MARGQHSKTHDKAVQTEGLGISLNNLVGCKPWEAINLRDLSGLGWSRQRNTISWENRPNRRSPGLAYEKAPLPTAG